MSKPSVRPAPEKPLVDPYPLASAHDFIARAYLWLMLLAFPLLMGDNKYLDITSFKGQIFYIIFYSVAILLLITLILNVATRVTQFPSITMRRIRSSLILPDIAIMCYWVLAVVSSVFGDNFSQSLDGMWPRNNGLIIQTMYIASYFILSRRLRAKKKDAFVFVWGGTALACVCLLHLFGVDILGLADAGLGAYAGPFYDTYTKFLGPIGNINLGSYVLAVCCVIAAGLYINAVSIGRDRYNIITLLCFCIMLWAELNMNTDAGYLALAVSAAAVLPVFAVSFAHVRRILTVFSAAVATLMFDRIIIDVILCSRGFGKGGVLLLAGTAICAVGTGVFFALGKFCKKEPSPKSLRIAAGALVAVIAIGGTVYALHITEPVGATAGAISGMSSTIEGHDINEKSDGTISELGQMLRGNFSDYYGHGRLFTWKRTLTLVGSSPMLGHGPDNFKDLFARYYQREMSEFFYKSSGGLDKAHNEFLDILICNGLLGLAAYLVFLGGLLYYSFRRRGAGLVAPVFGVAVICFITHSFFGYQLPLQSPVMWTMLGVCAGFILRERKLCVDKAGR